VLCIAPLYHIAVAAQHPDQLQIFTRTPAILQSSGLHRTGSPRITPPLQARVPPRRTAIAADIERGKEDRELYPDADPELLVDTVFGAIFYRLLFRSAPLNERFVEELVRQVFCGVRVRAEPLAPTSKRASRTKPKLKDRMDGQLTLDEIAKRSM
jgi:hypothetical protein